MDFTRKLKTSMPQFATPSKHFNWQFNHNTDELTLTAGELRYPLPDGKYADFDTVRVQRNTALGIEHVSWEC